MKLEENELLALVSSWFDNVGIQYDLSDRSFSVRGNSNSDNVHRVGYGRLLSEAAMNLLKCELPIVCDRLVKVSAVLAELHRESQVVENCLKDKV